MAKISLRVFKRGKPIYWIVGGIFVFVAFYLLFNKRSAAATGTTSYVATGPSEALQSQMAQINAGVQGASIAAGVELAKVQESQNEAGYALSAVLAQNAAQQTVALATLDTQRDIAEQGIAANVSMTASNNAYGLETARTAAQTQIGLAEISANTLTHQMDTQSAMFAEQSKNLVTQSLIAVAGSAKHKIEALQVVAPYVTGGASPAYPSIH